MWLHYLQWRIWKLIFIECTIYGIEIALHLIFNSLWFLWNIQYYGHEIDLELISPLKSFSMMLFLHHPSVPRPFRRSVGTIVSMLFMVVLTFGMCYNTVLYFRYLFGREDEVMHLTSFMSFSISLSSVTLICVYAKTRYYLSGYGRNLDTEGGRSRDWGWCEVLHQDYMVSLLFLVRYLGH